MKIMSLAIKLLVVSTTVFSVATVQASEQITLGRTILLKIGDEGAKAPLILCRRADAIKIQAEKNVYLKRAIVTFKNGDKKTINFYRDLKGGAETDWRSFAYKRCVKNIEVFGNSERTKAGIKIFGRK
ncbi:DUF2541 family protein [Aliivibrio sp. S4TY2]|jgi:hypothetical protein|uniref:DUF2541 family protein n=1 Tax=unclassified Aliivibrio TaxID=2645654 RepID=UPI002377DC0A|nr:MULTISPECIES: DUF2541 family protein [unclassified Aliivibrio]MDD9158097.1 DUF2541 family protein [Aliivibrio sp. S4TY2]MDD9162012.1 DUF2541 family protein [Aliivibrio sp. S4TY1]MDD9166094.1 DUF2541 family protein [Aliivibrio sp. S4MY2]MDD9170092.1 DUF2541 family protein [Aliivibrio sp. S4MY4]MDD9187102.1 DUF2541 family protein [Aliivibrio sp. S4MY3]